MSQRNTGYNHKVVVRTNIGLCSFLELLLVDIATDIRVHLTPLALKLKISQINKLNIISLSL